MIPFYIYGRHEAPLKFTAPSLTLTGGLDRQRLAERKVFLEAVNNARRRAETDPAIANYTRQQQKALSLIHISEPTRPY